MNQQEFTDFFEKMMKAVINVTGEVAALPPTQIFTDLKSQMGAFVYSMDEYMLYHSYQLCQQLFTDDDGDIVSIMRKVLINKGHDYNATDDRLGNFKEVASIIDVHPVQVCLMLIALKVTRLESLLGTGRTPVNESIKDNAIDLVNYCFLLCALIYENLNNK